ncbi:MAG: NAD(P)/FAD-dependent oxidoreductase [FCB group bacterium]|jgi:L-2-hydroxyglutarate oxidase LhgO
MEKVDITVIGAGVVGLAVASYIADKKKVILVVEKNKTFGQETSSRNSEVIHASIYYPKNSLKGKLCLEGNEMLYEICKKNNIPHRNSGKLIVAVTDEDVEKLPELLNRAKNNSAKGVKIIDADEIRNMEPNVLAKAALYCPSSGTIDSHSLMKFFEADAVNKDVNFAYRTEVTKIEKTNNGYILSVKDDEGRVFGFFTKMLINCSGLSAQQISRMAGIDTEMAGYKIHYRKGVYFRVMKQLEKYPKMLIYPPPPDSGAVGIHTTPDLAGGMRLGPDIGEIVLDIDYSVNDTLHELFYNSVKPFLPFIEYDDIQPDSAGILPQLQMPNSPMRDFIIRHEIDKGLENFINLVGIESPGLTASPAIGKMVAEMVKELGVRS